MAVKIIHEFSDEIYEKASTAIRKGADVCIFEEQRLIKPLSRISGVCIYAEKGSRYSIEATIHFMTQQAATEVQNHAKDKLKEKYSISGDNSGFSIFSQGSQYSVFLSNNKDGGSLQFVSSGKVVDPCQLRKDITFFLHLLETILNSGCALYGIKSSRVFYSDMKIFYPKNDSDKTSLNQISLKSVEFVSKDELNMGFKNIGGCEDAKETLQILMQGIEQPKILAAWGGRQPRGILFYGPPGTGKTLLAKAAAKEINANFFRVVVPEVTSMWYGESEKNIKQLFDLARKNAPAILFFDEIDAIASSRDNTSEPSKRVLTSILQEMDGIGTTNGVTVIGATNRVNDVDPALMRPGRFDEIVEVPLPDTPARKEIFGIQIKGRNIASENLDKHIDYEKLGGASDGFSGADISGVINMSISEKMSQLRNGKTPKPLCTEDLIASIRKYKNKTKKIKGTKPREENTFMYE